MAACNYPCLLDTMAYMERDIPQVYTITQLTRRIKGVLEAEIGSVWVAGEISNWTCAASGHAYFTLKDETSQLSTVMFKGRLDRLRFRPENGLEVLVLGNVSVYERRGAYQLIAEEMQPKGLGALQLAYEKLKKKLSEEGLFDPAHKKKLPLLPKRIGIVTSPTGAAIRDILHVLQRRFANVHVILYPARVQGEGAALEIAAGITFLDQYGVDVMIVGRGGGSLEDLWAFNEEVVARALFASQTPVISAVGHEIDYALSDFVADLRAPTPSAAAEIVVKEQHALAERVHQYRDRLERGIRHIFGQSRIRHAYARNARVFTQAEVLFREQRQTLDELRLRMERHTGDAMVRLRQRVERAQRLLGILSPQKRLEQQQYQLHALRNRFRQCALAFPDIMKNRYQAYPARLNALSPLAVLGRGYALAFRQSNNALLYNATQVSPGDAIRLWLATGEVGAEVTMVNEEGGICRYELK